MTTTVASHCDDGSYYNDDVDFFFVDDDDDDRRSVLRELFVVMKMKMKIDYCHYHHHHDYDVLLLDLLVPELGLLLLLLTTTTTTTIDDNTITTTAIDAIKIQNEYQIKSTHIIYCFVLFRFLSLSISLFRMKIRRGVDSSSNAIPHVDDDDDM